MFRHSSRLRSFVDRISIPRRQVLTVLPVAVAVILGTLVEPNINGRPGLMFSAALLNSWFWLQVPRTRLANVSYLLGVTLLLSTSLVPMINEHHYSQQWLLDCLAPFCASLVVALLFRLILRIRICDLLVRLETPELTSARPSILDYLALTFGLAVLSFTLRQLAGRNSSTEAVVQIAVTTSTALSWWLIAFLFQLRYSRGGHIGLSIIWMLILSLPMALLLCGASFLTSLLMIEIWPNGLTDQASRWARAWSDVNDGAIPCALGSISVGFCALLIRWCGIGVMPRNSDHNGILPAEHLQPASISDRVLSRIAYYSLSTCFVLLWFSSALSKTVIDTNDIESVCRGWPYPFLYTHEDTSSNATRWFAWDHLGLDLLIAGAVLLLQFLVVPKLIRRLRVGMDSKSLHESVAAAEPGSDEWNTKQVENQPNIIATPSFSLRLISLQFGLMALWLSPLWIAMIPGLQNARDLDVLLETELVYIHIPYSGTDRPFFQAITSFSNSVITDFRIPDFQAVVQDPDLTNVVLRSFASTHVYNVSVDKIGGNETLLQGLLRNPGLNSLSLNGWNESETKFGELANLPSLARLDLKGVVKNLELSVSSCTQLSDANLYLEVGAGDLQIQTSQHPCSLMLNLLQSGGKSSEAGINLHVSGSTSWVCIEIALANQLNITIDSHREMNYLQIDTPPFDLPSSEPVDVRLNIANCKDNLVLNCWNVNLDEVQFPGNLVDLSLKTQGTTVSENVIQSIPSHAITTFCVDNIQFNDQIQTSVSSWSNLALLQISPSGVTPEEFFSSLPSQLKILDVRNLQLGSEDIESAVAAMPQLGSLTCKVPRDLTIDFNNLGCCSSLTLIGCERVSFNGVPQWSETVGFTIGQLPIFSVPFYPCYRGNTISICDSNITLQQFETVASSAKMWGDLNYSLGKTAFQDSDYARLHFPNACRIGLDISEIDAQRLSEIPFEGEDRSVDLILSGVSVPTETIIQALQQNPTSNRFRNYYFVGSDFPYPVRDSTEMRTDEDAAEWYRDPFGDDTNWHLSGIKVNDGFTSALNGLQSPIIIHFKRCSLTVEICKVLLEHDLVVAIKLYDREHLSHEVLSLIKDHPKVNLEFEGTADQAFEALQE